MGKRNKQQKDDTSSSDEKGSGQVTLKGSKNYRSWARWAEIKLESKGLWGHITGEAKVYQKPDPEDDEHYEGSDDETYAVDFKKYTHYNKKKMQAVQVIWNSCSEDVQPVIEDTKDPKLMWSRLDQEYNQRTGGRGLSSTVLRDELWSLEYEYGTSIDKHFARMTQLIKQLREVNAVVTDEEVVAQIFRSMPPELKFFKSSYRAVMPKGNELRYQPVMEAFRTEVLELLRDDTKEEAFTAKDNKKSPARRGGGGGNRNGVRSPGGKRGQATRYCTECKMNNHWTSDCWVKNGRKDDKKPDLRKRKSDQALKTDNKKPKTSDKPKKKRSTAIDLLEDDDALMASVEGDVTDDSESDNEEVFSVSAKHSKSLVKWFTDSACTRNMASNKQYFVTLEPADKSMFVKVGNGAKIPVLGVGTVVLNCLIKDPSLPKPRLQEFAIKDVLYVPGLMANLLSVRTLAEKGFRTTFYEKTDQHPLTVQFTKKDKVYLTGTIYGNQYCLDMVHPKEFRNTALITEVAEDEIRCYTVNDQGMELSEEEDTMESDETSDEEESHPKRARRRHTRK